MNLWGLWRHGPGGGWCEFLIDRSRPDAPISKVAGSREEAVEAREQFIREGQDGALYIIAPFQPAIEPTGESSDADPSDAQGKLLEYVEKTGNMHNAIGKLPFQRPNVVDALTRRGWVMPRYNDRGVALLKPRLQLTMAGVRALTKHRIQTSKKKE